MIQRFDPDFIKRVRQAVRSTEKVRLSGPRKARQQHQVSLVKWARATAVNEISANRWEYYGHLLVRDPANRQFVTAEVNFFFEGGPVILNPYEEVNTGSGIEGNNVNVDNLTGTFALKSWVIEEPEKRPPIPVIKVSELEYMMLSPNSIDGACG